ncbi:MAG: NUDIX hydrolase [Chitinophagaceae bacterium]
MNKYSKQIRILVAIDCIIFGFDGNELKILLIQRGLEPEIGKWSLMGGFVQRGESLKESANRVLLQLTGLEKVYLEQLHTFGDTLRDPIERTISVTYFSLLDLTKYKAQLSAEFHAEWFPLKKHPKLIFDHNEMVQMAKAKLKYKASLHPILFELLSEKFTLPQLQGLFEEVYQTSFDKRNFSRKILSTGLIQKLNEKEKESSKKGAFYYKLDKKHYKTNFHHILRFIPNPNELL